MAEIRYITQAEADRLRDEHVAAFRPRGDLEFTSGYLGVLEIHYYVVPDDDPRAGTVEREA